MKTSQKGIELIKKFEGCVLTAYKPVAAEKYYTIGYGHYGADVSAGMKISSAQAEAYLIADLASSEKAVASTGLSLNQNQFDALVSFTYNCGAGNLKKLVKGRSLSEIADALLLYNKGSGKVLAGLVKRRKAERELFLQGAETKSGSSVKVTKTPVIKIIIGSARIDEKGTVGGGKTGDQKQKSVPDYAGEVSFQEFYEHKKGWVILRHPDPAVAKKIAEAMERACDNKNIGYNQFSRLQIITAGTDTKKPADCDCSSLVRRCIIEATGKDPGNFTTANEAATLKAFGMKEIPYKKSSLQEGDVLVTKTKGHTVVVTSITELSNPYREPASTIKKGMKGDIVRWIQYQLCEKGYKVDIDGDFGDETEKAVIKLQSDFSLEPDGKVGPLTKGVLEK